MTRHICMCDECQRDAVVFTYPVFERQFRHLTMYCEEHAEVFRANYRDQQWTGQGRSERCGDAVRFDFELLVLDHRQDGPCSFSLREVGGSRRVDCQTGFFEVAAIQRELEGLSNPRPLTHHAMASTITALGGRLERVVIDKYDPEESGFFEAKAHVRQGDETVLLDMRPSDAVVLAVICDAPIAVSDSVLMALGNSEQ